MKAVFLLILAVVIGIASAAYFYFFSTRHIALPLRPPAGASTTKVPELFRPRPSRLVATVRIPFASLRAKAEEAAPRSIGGEYRLGDAGGLNNIRIRPSISRDPIQLTPEVGSSPPRIQLSSRLHGSVGVSADKRVIIDLLLTKVNERIGVSETIENIDADIRGWVSPGVGADWAFIHQEQFDVAVNKAEILILGIIPISVREEVQKAVMGTAPAMISAALNSFGAANPIRPQVAKVWGDLFNPVKIGSDPGFFLVSKPESVHLQSLAFNDPDHLTLRVAIDGIVDTHVAASVPPSSPTPLPDLEFEPVIDTKFRIALPVTVSLDEVNRTLASRKLDEQIRLTETESVRVKSCEFASLAGDVYIKAEVEGESRRLGATVDGTIFLQGGLEYDGVSRKLRFKNVDFSTETKSMLVDTAAWLLKDEICRRIEAEAHVDVGMKLDRLKAEVNERYTSLIVAPGVAMKLRLDAVEFGGATVADGAVIAEFDLSGEIACEIDPG